MNTVYILRAFEKHEGQYFCGVYSTLENALKAKGSLPKSDCRGYQIDTVTVDSEPEVLYF